MIVSDTDVPFPNIKQIDAPELHRGKLGMAHNGEWQIIGPTTFCRNSGVTLLEGARGQGMAGCPID